MLLLLLAMFLLLLLLAIRRGLEVVVTKAATDEEPSELVVQPVSSLPTTATTVPVLESLLIAPGRVRRFLKPSLLSLVLLLLLFGMLKHTNNTASVPSGACGQS